MMTYNQTMILSCFNMASGGGWVTELQEVGVMEQKSYYFTATSCSWVNNAQMWRLKFSVKVDVKQFH